MENPPVNPRGTPSLQLNSLPIHPPTWDNEPGTEKAANSIPNQQSDQAIQSLCSILTKNEVKHLDLDTEFWSRALLKRLLTRDRVQKELVSVNLGNANKYCDCIMLQDDKSCSTPSKTYLCIFALLVLLDKVKDIATFIRKGICDEDLPLKVDKSHPPECFIGWKPFEIDYFRTKQRCVVVQYFDMGPGNEVQHFTIKPGTTLPWLENDSSDKNKGEGMVGGYGVVQKYKIDPDSHKFTPILKSVGLDSTWVAVKSLNKPEAEMDAKAFKREVNNLKRFGGQAHRHLITLLATYTLHERYHFIFPAAECDLDKYWNQRKGPLIKPLMNPNEDDVVLLRWISKQIQGLVAALSFIHKGHSTHLEAETRYGRHGDLKPENILWFKSTDHELGIFVITDLGIADIHRDQSKSNVPNKGLPASPGYRPPECDIHDGKISRAYDVWTLGCVLLEMVCWLLGGNEQRKQFKEDRTSLHITGVRVDTFFDIVTTNKGYGVQVKRSVTNWIDLLHNSPGCTQHVHDLLDLIGDEMLVAPSTKRKRTPELLKSVNEMHDKTDQCNYFTEPQPMERITKCEEPYEIELCEMLRNTSFTHRHILEQLRARAARAGETYGECTTTGDSTH